MTSPQDPATHRLDALRRAWRYLRYDTLEELQLLAKPYGVLVLCVNFFQLQMKLLEKTR